MRSRITTGNSELDAMIFGGIPDGNHVLIAGGPGAGKTLASFEFLYKNALKGENGLFISLEEKASAIISNAKDAFSEFGDVDKLLDEQKIVVNEQNVEGLIAEGESGGGRRYEFSKLMSDVVASIQSSNAKRIVIDSVSVLRLLLKDKLEYRTLMISMLSVLKKNKTTSLSTLELQEYGVSRSIFYPEFFLYDGVIMLHSPFGSATTAPSLQVVKMRGTDHSFQNIPYKITGSGVKLLKLGGQA